MIDYKINNENLPFDDGETYYQMESYQWVWMLKNLLNFRLFLGIRRHYWGVILMAKSQQIRQFMAILTIKKRKKKLTAAEDHWLLLPVCAEYFLLQVTTCKAIQRFLIQIRIIWWIILWLLGDSDWCGPFTHWHVQFYYFTRCNSFIRASR